MATQITTKGVLTINGKQVEETVSNLKKNVRLLTSDLNKLTIGTDEWNAKLQELRQGQARLAEVQNEIRATTRAVDDAGDSFHSFYQKSADSLQKLGSDILSGNLSWKSLGSTIKLFAAESWVAISSIPLVGWLAAIAAGIGLVVKEAIDYNKEISPQLKLLENLGLDKKILPQLRALKEAFGIEYEEIADMMDNLVDAGIINNQVASLDSLKIALAKAPNKNELISFLNNSAESAKKLGLTFEQLINIKQDLESTPMNPEKVFGAMDTFVNRVLSQSEKIQPVLEKSFGGDFSNKMYKGLIDGSLKYSDALSMIYKKGEQLKISDKERADVAKALFGKSGASAYNYNEILQVISDSYKELNEDLTESQKRTLALADAYEFQAEKKDEAYNSSSLRAFMFDMKVLWINAKAWFFDFISGTVNGFKLFGLNFKATFQNIPTYTKTVFKAIGLDLINLWQMFGAGKQLLKDVFTLKWENIDTDLKLIQNKFQNSFKNIAAAGKEIGKDFGASGNINQNSLKQIKAENKLKADALEEIEKREKKRVTPENTKDKDKDNKKKADDLKNKLEEQKKASKKLKEELEKELKDSNKAYEDAEKQKVEIVAEIADEKLKIQEDSLQKELAMQENARQDELRNLKENYEKIQTTILELEKKKLETKSPTAKANYQKAIDQEREAMYQNDLLIEKTEETHQFRLKTIREKWKAKKFEDDARKSQREIENSRRDREQEITDITSLEAAKAQLQAQIYLKLTDQELAAIDNLEDAKVALREDADRALLKKQEESIRLQIENLTAALNDPALSEEAKKKLAENLDFLKDKITQVKSAIDGGNYQNAKKVTKEQKAAKENVDILGFSAADWEKSWENLNTTEGKIKALGMAFQALGNAGQMFAQLQQSLNERELRQFTKIQTQKKKALLKQLNEGYINQEEYTKATEKLEVDAANKKADIEYKQAKADKIAKIFGAIGATAQAVATALTAGPVAGPILAAIVGALGAVQVGIISSQPLPEKPSFASGGFTGNGFGSADASGYKPAGIVHENEWVAPEWMTADPRTAKVIDYLESVRIGKTRPMADGGYSDNTTKPVASNGPSDNSSDTMVQYFVVMQQLKDLLQKIYDEGVVAEMVDSEQNGKLFKKAIKKYETITSRASGK